MQLVFLRVEVVKELTHSVNPGSAFENQALLLIGQIRKRNIQAHA